MTFAEETPVHLKMDEFFIRNTYVASGFPVHLKLVTDDCLKPFAASFVQLDSCHLSCNRSAGGTSNVAYQFTSSQMVINNTQERQ